MARAYASRIIPAPVEAVWPLVRNFNALPAWHPGIKSSEIEDGRDADTVGAIRSFTLADGTHVRERLLELDDCRYRFRYNFEKPAFPVANYIATFTLIPLTDRDASFAEWRADFDEPPGESGRYVDIVSNAVFADGLAALAEKTAGQAIQAGATRWQGFRPAKVFCASVIRGPIAEVWRRIRDFSGMEDWHPDIHEMRMLDGARPDKVSGTRDFRVGDNALHEQLTLLSDHRHTFRYRITKTTMPWLNYHAGVRLHPITATNETLAVWTADWTASPNDDLALIPAVHHDVFQRAFDTLNERFFARSA